MKKALLHSHREKEIYENWGMAYYHLIDSLVKKNFEVYKDYRLNFNKPEEVKYSPKTLGLNQIQNTFFDLCVYNHSDLSQIETLGHEVNCSKKIFLKRTVPDAYQTTLDPMGYGSYSSITYNEPPYKLASPRKVSEFYSTKVKSWINNNQSKWGMDHFGFREKINEEDYILIIGQCDGDEVLVRQDFGMYFFRLANLVKELVKVTNKKIIIKLHPYTNGKTPEFIPVNTLKPEKPTGKEAQLKEEYERLSPNIKVITGFRSIHDYLPKASCVILGNSGAGFEAMMHLKPIISFCQPEYHWVTYDLRKACDLRRALKTEDWFNSEYNAKFLYWYMMEYCYYDRKSAFARLGELIDE